MGIDGDRGVLADMAALQIWDTFSVKVQTIKTAIEVWFLFVFLGGSLPCCSDCVYMCGSQSATLLLRIDDVLSGVSKKKKGDSAAPAAPAGGEDGEHAEE
jgi:T-complex protein 1 subunit gamma